MNTKIKFGTDGWRAIIDQEFTIQNVKRVAIATAIWINKNSLKPKIVIGHDCRRNGSIYAETAAATFASKGLHVLYHQGFATTPMISLATHQLDCSVGIIITASHNPPSYNGYKIKLQYGGPALQQDIQAIESLIPDDIEDIIDDYDQLLLEQKISIVNIEDLYYSHITSHFDISNLTSKLRIAYDAMYGSGQYIARRLFPDAHFLHCVHDDTFQGIAPEPLARNLSDLQSLLAEKGNIDLAIITDGDADRIAFYDDKQRFVDAHHIILLCIYFQKVIARAEGDVVIAFSCSERIKKLCDYYNIPYTVTPIGFKYICEKMLQNKVLLGGEESGGIAVSGHIPERDGIWISLILLSLMKNLGKKLSQIIEEDIYAITGPIHYERWDLHISDTQKTNIMIACKEDKYKSFGNYTIQRIEKIDGYKYHLSDSAWIMLRLSGTEPILRIYAETSNESDTKAILQATRDAVLA